MPPWTKLPGTAGRTLLCPVAPLGETGPHAQELFTPTPYDTEGPESEGDVQDGKFGHCCLEHCVQKDSKVISGLRRHEC